MFQSTASSPTDATGTRTSLSQLLLLIVLVGLAWQSLFAMPAFSAAAQSSNAITVVSAANYQTPVAPESIAALFGANLTAQIAIAKTRPLPTSLGGVTVRINGVAAGLFYVSPSQINFLIPAGTAAGEANVSVTTSDNSTRTGTVLVATAAPTLFTANSSGSGVAAAVALRVKTNNSLAYEPVAQFDAATASFQTLPLNPGPVGEKLFLILYASGARNITGTLRVLLGGVEITPIFAGAAPDFVGLEQINVEVPRSLIARGRLNLSLLAPDTRSSNVAEIEIANAPNTGTIAPTIASISPAQAVAGETITITGNGFATAPEANTVVIGGVETRAVESATATRLVVRVPYGATGGKLAVRTAQGEAVRLNGINVNNSVSGLVTDSTSNPLPNVTVSVSGKTTRTRSDGSFTVRDIPAGQATLRVDATALPIAPKLPVFTRMISVIGNRDNLQATIALQLPGQNSIEVPAPNLNGSSSGLMTLANNDLTFELNEKTVATFPAEITEGLIHLTRIESQHAPANLPAGVFSSALAQLTPFGIKLNPGGKLIFPNADGYAANAQLTLYRLNQTTGSPSLGSFVTAGTATVSADGKRIETAADAVTETSIYFVARPRSTTAVSGRVVDSDNHPVRLARVTCAGQTALTDGNGSFVLLNVPVPANAQLTVEAAFTRPTGRTDRVTRAGITAAPNATTRIASNLVLPSPATQSNRPPALTAPSALTVNETIPREFPLLASDPDANQTVSVSVTGAAFASIVLNQGSYALRLAPLANAAGTHTLTLRVTDNQNASTTRTVAVTVIGNRPPVANTQVVTTNEDTAKAIALSGSDFETSALTYAVVTPPTRGTLTGTASNLLYTPAANFNGTDSFTFKANDGRLDSAPATVAINVTAVNDAPVLVVPAAQTAKTLQPISFDIAASDVDQNQTLNFLANGMPGGATLAALSPMSRRFTWTPGENQLGTFVINFSVSDSGAPVLSDTKSVAINVTASNRPPLANAQAVTTNEDAPKQISLTASDPDGNALTYALLTQPTNGTLSGNAPNVTYTPKPNYFGGDSFTFKVNDGKTDSATATVAITVAPVNDPPVLTVPGAQAALTERALSFDLSAAEIDQDQTLTLIASNLPSGATVTATSANSRRFSWTPSENQIGSFIVNFKVSDNGTPLLSDTKSVTIMVDSSNRAPTANVQTVATNEDAAKAFTLTGLDLDGQTLKFIVVSNPLNGTLSGTAPNLSYTPKPNFNGADSFTFKVNDGKVDSALATVALNVAPVNDAPALTVISQANAKQGQPLSFEITAADLDQGQALIFTTKNLPSGATITSLSATSLRFNWTPALAQVGDYAVQFTVNDNGTPTLGDTKTIAIKVEFGNRAPSALAQNVSTSEDSAKTITLSGTDPDNNALNYSIVSQPSYGTLSGAAPNLTYTPRANYNGPDSFTFKANDGQLDSAPATVLLTVTEVNDTPVLKLPAAKTATRGQELSFDLTATDVDKSQQFLFTAEDLPSGAALTTVDANTMRFTWTPNAKHFGTYAIKFKVSDNGSPSLSDVETISINVTCGEMACWTQANGPFGGYMTALLVNGNDLYAGTADGNVFLSKTDGQSWQVVNNGLSNQYVYALAASGPYVFAGTSGGLYRSSNAGQSWIPIIGEMTDQPVIACAVNAGNLFASVAGRGIWRSTNNGQTWTSVSNGLGKRTAHALAINGTTLFAGTSGGAFVSTNNGQNWTAINSGLKTLDVRALAFSNGKIFAGTNGGGVFLSTNNGQTWTAINNGLTGLFIAALTVNGETLVAGTGGNGAFASPNGGQSWTAINNGLTAQSIEALTLRQGSLFAATANGVFRSTNNGQLWAPANAGIAALSVESLTVNNGNVLASTGGGNLLSSNSGQTWATTTTASATSSNAVTLTVGGNLFAGTTFGIFLSPDGGKTWKPINNGIGSAAIQALVLNGNTIYAATNAGVFYSTNLGQSWSALNEGLINLDIRSLAISNGKLFAAPAGSSVFVRPLL